MSRVKVVKFDNGSSLMKLKRDTGFTGETPLFTLVHLGELGSLGWVQWENAPAPISEGLKSQLQYLIFNINRARSRSKENPQLTNDSKRPTDERGSKEERCVGEEEGGEGEEASSGTMIACCSYL